jgi:hypothetical protein
MMSTKSKYDLSDSQMLRVPRAIWDRYEKKYKKAAAEHARDDLDLCIGVEKDNDGRPKD